MVAKATFTDEIGDDESEEGKPYNRDIFSSTAIVYNSFIRV